MVVPGAGIEPARGFPQGIFVPLRLSPLPGGHHGICGLDFTFAIPQPPAALRIRQEPSSLYTFLGGTCDDQDTHRQPTEANVEPRLSSVLQPPSRAAVPPTLTPFTPAVSGPGAQFTQVPCVYQFRHPGTGCARILSERVHPAQPPCDASAQPRARRERRITTHP